jgi:hypothetical protein
LYSRTGLPQLVHCPPPSSLYFPICVLQLFHCPRLLPASASMPSLANQSTPSRLMPGAHQICRASYTVLAKACVILPCRQSCSKHTSSLLFCATDGACVWHGSVGSQSFPSSAHACLHWWVYRTKDRPSISSSGFLAQRYSTFLQGRRDH